MISFAGRKPLDFASLRGELEVPDSAGYLEVLANYK
jgi:hypothetical protein